MTITQKKQLLEISTQRVWKHHRGELRRIFASCEESGYSVDGYVISRVARWLEIKDAALALAAPFLADPSQLTRALGKKYEAAANFDAQLQDIEAL
jgi:hypothetical protein